MKSYAFNAGLRWCLPLVAVLMFASCGGDDNNSPNDVVNSSNTSVPSTAFTATLNGAQETPPTASTATATGAVVIDPTSKVMNATIVTAGIAGTMAHIHEGAPGVAGPIIFPFTESAPGSGIWTARTTLTDAQINTFNAGNYYFNVHSAAFPQGEIRGQIVRGLQASSTLTTGSGSGTPGSQFASYTNVLSSSQAVPPTASQAIALSVTVIDSVAKTLSASVVAVGITGNAAHIHEGAAGVVGPVIFTLAETPAGSGIWTVKTPITDAQISSLNAGNYYTDIHSAAFPAGEVRGQIVVTAGATPTGGGATGTGMTGTGAGTTGNGTGTTGTGAGTGTTGTGAGTTGTGTTGTGATGTGATGTGTTGAGTTGTGATGSATTGAGTPLATGSSIYAEPVKSNGG